MRIEGKIAQHKWGEEREPDTFEPWDLEEPIRFVIDKMALVPEPFVIQREESENFYKALTVRAGAIVSGETRRLEKANKLERTVLDQLMRRLVRGALDAAEHIDVSDEEAGKLEQAALAIHKRMEAGLDDEETRAFVEVIGL